MTEELWDQFLSFAAQARKKPSFDAEERDPKLQLAAAVREVLELARRGGQWQAALQETSILRAVVPGTIAAPIPLDLATPSQGRRFRRWAFGAAPTCLGVALGGYLDAGADPVSRFTRFASCAEGAHRATEWDDATTIVFGSLFNFAVDPTRLPFVRPVLFRRLASILGYPIETDSPEAEYESCLSFTRVVANRLGTASIPVRDALDAQSLILSGSRFHRLWTAPSEPCAGAATRTRAGGARAADIYLSVCAIFRDEGPYLREWLEFHRLVGVERFYLYDNGSIDESRELLAPYVDDGIVVIRDWPGEHRQLPAYEHCAAEHAQESRWIAFLDLDEYLFSPLGVSVPHVLERLERFPGVGVNWAVFGPSGHASKPDGLVIESYVRRLNSADNRTIRTIADPTCITRCLSPHHFVYDGMHAVDENGYPILSYFTQSVSYARLRVNHYFTKSLEEYRARAARVRPDQFASRRSFPAEELLRIEQEHSERDDAIFAYLPALRKRLSG